MPSNTAGLPEADLDRAHLSPEAGPAQSIAIFVVLAMQICNCCSWGSCSAS